MGHGVTFQYRLTRAASATLRFVHANSRWQTNLGPDYTCAMRSLSLTPFFLLAVVLSAASAFSQTASPPDRTIPPAGQHPVLTAVGRGVQIYTCQAIKKQYQWVFVAPVARLFTKTAAGDEQEIGSHGDGPVWIDQDGSSVHGQVLVKQASPDAGSIPWLLLKSVTPTGSGILSAVEYIRRSDTKGGVAPADGCNAAHLGEFSRVPYTAAYTFYASK